MQKRPFNSLTMIKDATIQNKYKKEVEKELRQLRSNDWKTINDIIQLVQNYLGYIKKIGPNQNNLKSRCSRNVMEGKATPTEFVLLHRCQ